MKLVNPEVIISLLPFTEALIQLSLYVNIHIKGLATFGTSSGIATSVWDCYYEVAENDCKTNLRNIAISLLMPLF
jgi:hypothetical protein